MMKLSSFVMLSSRDAKLSSCALVELSLVVAVVEQSLVVAATQVIAVVVAATKVTIVVVAATKVDALVVAAKEVAVVAVRVRTRSFKVFLTKLNVPLVP
jgi:hypothetical protein